MSDSGTRPKIRAKRFDKLGSTKNSEVANSGGAAGYSSAGPSRGRSLKRTFSRNDGDNCEKTKKICVPVKNLGASEGHAKTPTSSATKVEQNGGKCSANARLNKLRENFKREFETENINNNSKNIKNGNKISDYPRNQGKQGNPTSSLSPRKNLAKSRLNKLQNRSPNTPDAKYSSENTPVTVEKRPMPLIDLVTPPEIREKGSSSSSPLVNESPLAQRLFNIRNNRNITLRARVPETSVNTCLELSKQFETPNGLTDSFQIVKEISSPLELELSTQPPAVKTSVSQRLLKIRNETDEFAGSSSARNVQPIIRWDSSQMDTLSREPSATSLEEKCNKCLKIATTAEWIDSHQCLSKEIDNSISDSLVVNVDDTVLNKTDLLDPDDNSMEWDDIERTDTPVNAPVPIEKAKDNIICVVADTNIFLHHLNKVKDIIFGKFLGSRKVIVYVPWMVIEELDYQKQNAREPLKSLALGAVRYINRCLSEQDSKLKGQSVEDMSLQKDIGYDPDDKILSCAMQAAEKYETVFLLSNDINLRNKAMINKVTACTPNDVIAKINSKMSKNTTKAKTILLKLQIMCSQVICQCCKDAYGDAWSKMHLLNNAPWSFAECLKRFQKYWTAVFRDKLLKQCSKTVEDLVQIMRVNNGTFCDDTEEFNQFMKLALNLCVFLKDVKECKGSVQNTMNEILKVVESSTR